MRRLPAVVLTVSLGLSAGSSRAAELVVSDAAEAAPHANLAFSEGRLEEAERGYRYLATLNIRVPDPQPNIAIILRDLGQPDAALPAWTKATLSPGADGFIWNQRGWAYMALGNAREAGTAFRRALDISTTTANQAEANLGLALSFLRDDHPKAALSPLRQAWMQGPFAMPMAAYLTGLAELRSGDKQAALANLRQAISLDPTNLEAIREIAELCRRVGDNHAAWGYYYRIRKVDPDDEDAAKRMKKLAKHISGDPLDMRPIRRLSRPFLDSKGKGQQASSQSPEKVRVAIFSSNATGRPEPALRLYFMPNTAFRIETKTGEVVRDQPQGLVQWEIVFREDTNIVEVRDTAHILQYTSKQPFSIIPDSRYGSVLIKSARFRDTESIDPGDRELRGTLEVVPTPYGFILINELPVEDYLLGAVSAALPQGAPLEAYKAQAVVSRTKVLWRQAHHEAAPFFYDLCDSPKCQTYVGLNSETALAAKAVRETEGYVIKTTDREIANVLQHLHCGGLTESGAVKSAGDLKHLKSVSDSQWPKPRLDSPEALERWMHSAPKSDRYCEQGSLIPPVASRWMRVLHAEDLRERAERMGFQGPMWRVRALRRSSAGRVLALEVSGPDDSMVIEGDDAIEAFLSPGTLRSMLFTIQPLYARGRPSRYVLWGAGTGHGLGMCSAGAIGQAGIGRTWKQILAQYFPGLTITSAALEKAAIEAKTKGKRPRPKNPRRRKRK